MITPTPPPRRIRFVDEARTLLAADWPDGHVSVYPLPYLRGWCPCAECQGHSGAHRFVPPPDVAIQVIKPVGTYAIALGWSDGHGSGIHPFEALRDLCPCDACDGPAAGTPEDVANACRAANARG